jgi:methionyl-tRNA synthetase
VAKKLKKDRVLVLCALPYTNAIPHIGNIVGSHLPADVFARYCRIRGYETTFVGGTDENGTPTEVAALELKISPKELTDVLYNVHRHIYDWFEISYDNFSRTSRPIHHKTTQDFFLEINKGGFISEGILRLPYCEKDGLFLPDRYVIGKCPVCGYEFARGDQCENCATLLDPDQLIEPKCKIDGSEPVFKNSKHLFLELGKLERDLGKWITGQKHWRKQVTSLALGWIREGLKKRSITRDLRWGVPVPLDGYRKKVFYVWFDAPIGYISSTKEWAEKSGSASRWRDYWLKKDTRIYNFLGKDNIPFHTVFWPGMLIAHGGYNLPYDVVGLQYLNYEGDKISKSRGRGISGEKVVEAGLSADIWRFYLIHLIPETKDTEFKWDEFSSRINNELVGNIGNFVHRTLSFAWRYFDGRIEAANFTAEDDRVEKKIRAAVSEVQSLLDHVKLRDGLAKVSYVAAIGNEYFQRNEPWNLVKTDRERCTQVIYFCANVCKTLAVLLYPYLPSSAEKIARMLGSTEQIKWNDIRMPLQTIQIEEPRVLFKKLDEKEVARVRSAVEKKSELKGFFK